MKETGIKKSEWRPQAALKIYNPDDWPDKELSLRKRETEALHKPVEAVEKKGAVLHNPTLRVMRILQLIDHNPQGLSLSAIGEQLDLPKGTISPILKTLTALGFIRCERTLYRIGLRSFELGLSFGSATDVMAAIRAQMKAIVAETGEICQCGVPSGLNVLYVMREDSDNPISIISKVGMRVPAYMTGLGKAMLSCQEDAWLEEAYAGYVFERHTPNTIQSFDRLLLELMEVRRNGIATENEESKVGICCMAVPLILDGSMRAAISVTVPKFRMTEEKQKLIGRALLTHKRVIEEISQVQGYHWS